MQRADPRPQTPVSEFTGYLRDFIDLFLYESPYWRADFTNPFFYTGARNVRWLESSDALRDFNRRVLQIASMVTVVVLALGALLAWSSFDIVPFLLLVTGVSLLAGVAVDAFCVYYGAYSVRALQRGVMLDLIRTTNVHAPTVMHARLRVARLYAWRPFFMLAVSRMVIVLLWGLILAESLLEPLAVGVSLSAAEQIQFRGVVMGLYLGASVFLLSEPFWRYRAMTAVGVLQAIRRADDTRLWFGAALQVIGFYLWQGAVIVGGYLVAMFSLAFMDFGRVTAYLVPSDTALIPFVSGMLAVLVPALYMLVVRQSQIRFASNDTLRDDSYLIFQGYD